MRADTPRPWWCDAIFYQVYPRSFADSNGDGVGDLDGVLARLDYLALLGVDAIWLNPVTVSPMVDHGYDVADPRDVDPLFGGLTALDRLITAAHQRGIKITMDLVPNHTSSAHPWFQAALSAGPGSPARDRYLFRDGRGPAGEQPPNNWESVFGGPAWTRVVEPDGRPGQWYLHLFDAEQPDLNWANPDVFDDFEKTLRFWLERGVDGFRIDVAHGMAKPPDLPDMEAVERDRMLRNRDDDPRFNHPDVHAIHRDIRTVMNDYPDAVTIGEVWVHDNARWAEYLRPDELHLGFNFRLVQARFDAADIRDAIDNSLAAAAIENATPTWTLSNHDVDREVTRYGGGAVGLHRARAMAMVMLALPGAVFIYNGQELGLPNVELPDEVLQDPTWERSGHTDRGRDGCRVPMPWEGDTPPFGFSPSKKTWLPMPTDWAPLTVERQLADADSTLSFFRRALEIREKRAEFSGGRIEWLTTPGSTLMFARPGGLLCVLNAGNRPVRLPDGELLLASAPLANHRLPPNAAAWLAS
ncbi:glycoside hydrolase family 13 protein [Mycobacterium shimoidei]|uniref:Putative alpha-glucosidase AglA (Maltase) (Glucoinvertase) (Glucosidosucrase) (Maltase-glucoamylase) (Lysosomal alpha-glucosidase) (Acid maltase) [Mycobacterium tuberculosis H37Rv] n=1 Tax=Mycobacterium shimoidei TaxID=29313 RepID=A0A1E3TKS8_MYCSH|nr:glycoside hydrolase family 13 protein [Mycobacterium shimoidei]MCV7259908.1 glycoside hydrolase family 13 protein [Mycobacterium shimoidei]ODR15048.1 alpha-amylase [Mycobacterium shimoidei]ORW79213.1 alpha-amylase [Mycobacterium shimoidei]SRX94544.1 putative alpha-glucosidase AglA (maltase) (glucoinvertase) (glucosidosucrase) (maltase-glucoamylase) (lysosomal alpha-glucosidase) (acid maltase) [Mycobacterium tuberculosis H37Rv] [Mycobacterium shimoidei]